MGKLNTRKEREATLLWANKLEEISVRNLTSFSIAILKQTFDDILKKYFALACLSRSKIESKDLVEDSRRQVFRIRTLIERSIEQTIVKWLREQDDTGLSALFKGGSFYGRSKKQGTSIRMPLTACQATQLCASACYAHDVLDAAPLSVIRGVINGVIAASYEAGQEKERSKIMLYIKPHTRRAVCEARKESVKVPVGFSRRAYIRFAHVGEIAPFSKFANALATQIQ